MDINSLTLGHLVNTQYSFFPQVIVSTQAHFSRVSDSIASQGISKYFKITPFSTNSLHIGLSSPNGGFKPRGFLLSSPKHRLHRNNATTTTLRTLAIRANIEKCNVSLENGKNILNSKGMNEKFNLPSLEEARKNVPDGMRKWLSAIWDVVSGKRRAKINMATVKDLGEVSQKTRQAVKEFYGKNVSKQIIRPEEMAHIYREHGKNPDAEIAQGQIPMTAEMISTIPDVLANPDYVEKGKRPTKKGYDTILLAKEYADGKIHVVEAIQNDNVLEVYTAYIWDKEKMERLEGFLSGGRYNSNPPRINAKGEFTEPTQSVPTHKYTKNSGNKQDEDENNTLKYTKRL